MQAWQIRVRGQVQGVGFRPFVWQVARARGLRGVVSNDAEGVLIRLLSAVAFVATKLEAFASRGKGDFLTSHDLEDVLNVVDGREQLVEEMAGAPGGLRAFVARTFAGLLAQPDFMNVLPGLIAEPERTDVVLARLREMCC